VRSLALPRMLKRAQRLAQADQASASAPMEVEGQQATDVGMTTEHPEQADQDEKDVSEPAAKRNRIDDTQQGGAPEAMPTFPQSETLQADVLQASTDPQPSTPRNSPMGEMQQVTTPQQNPRGPPSSPSSPATPPSAFFAEEAEEEVKTREPDEPEEFESKVESKVKVSDLPPLSTADERAKISGNLNAVKVPSSAQGLCDGMLLSNAANGQGMVLPVAGFGTYKLKKGEAKGPILDALRAGYRLIDTAQVYENEADVGDALRESGISRDDVIIETKVWRSSHGYDRTMKAFKQSLKKLGVDCIDLYLIHWPGAKTGWPLPKGTICPPEWTPALRDEGTWRAMEDLYLQGKVKAIGVANYSIRHLQQLLKVCRVKPMVNQVEFHPLLVQSKLIEFCKEQGIVVQAYASLGSSDAGQAQTFFNFPPVRAASKSHQVTPAQVLLRWALQKGALVVPKSSRPERIAENSQLFKFSLSDEEVSAIDKLHRNRHLAWKGLDPDTIE